jgi:hypothetical protein
MLVFRVVGTEQDGRLWQNGFAERLIGIDPASAWTTLLFRARHIYAGF